MLYNRQRHDGIKRIPLQRQPLDEGVPRKTIAGSGNRNWVWIYAYIVGFVDICRQRATSAANVQHTALQERPNGRNPLPPQEWGKHSLRTLISHKIALSRRSPASYRSFA